MDRARFIQKRVHRYYWNDDVNCATTQLKVLAEIHALNLHAQVVDGSVGLHGAGGFGAQCGLVEGVLLFIGIWGQQQGWPVDKTIGACREYAAAFEKRFGSLVCSKLRPQGFDPQNPPHLCEKLTREAVEFAAEYTERLKMPSPSSAT